MTDASRKRRTSATTVSRAAPVRVEAPSPAAPAKTDDVVLVHGQSEDGAFRVLRKRGEELHVGEMRPLEEGKALTPGGTYSAKFGTSHIRFQVDAQARPGPTPIVGRLVRMD